jgi:hypothetical protein
MTGGGSCFGSLIVIGKDNNPISGLGLDNVWFWVLFGAITAAGLILIGRLRRPAREPRGLPTHSMPPQPIGNRMRER